MMRLSGENSLENRVPFVGQFLFQRVSSYNQIKSRKKKKKKKKKKNVLYKMMCFNYDFLSSIILLADCRRPAWLILLPLSLIPL